MKLVVPSLVIIFFVFFFLLAHDLNIDQLPSIELMDLPNQVANLSMSAVDSFALPVAGKLAPPTGNKGSDQLIAGLTDPLLTAIESLQSHQSADQFTSPKTESPPLTVSESPDEYYEWSPRPYEPNPRPPVEQIVYDWNVTGDPQWLLNFAISGFPKCGTSTLMHYFANNPEIYIHTDERCELGANQHVPLIRELYLDSPPGDIVRGIKCPRDLESTLSLPNYERYFPKTDHIVGVRHPIKWFESFYNHRIQNRFKMPNMTHLVGACGKRSYGVCTNRANFHVGLALFGKTPANESEFELMPSFAKNVYKHYNLQGRVFLYEVEQLADKNETRAWQFRKDLQHFLYLRKKLPPMVWFRPGRKRYTPEEQQEIDAKKIDICDDDWKVVRSRLMSHARNVSKWLRNYFLPAAGVYVSSRGYLETLLEDWKRDPCADGGSYKMDKADLNCTKYGCFVKSRNTR